MTPHPFAGLQADSVVAFASLDVTFAPGVNVIVGENGSGKSQLLKLLYSAAAVLNDVDPLSPQAPRRVGVNAAMAAKLMGVFRPDALGRLTNRRRGRNRGEVAVNFADLTSPLSYSFASSSRTEVKVDSVPEAWLDATPVFLPTRELLSLYPGFVALYDERSLEFDETWRDTANLLARPARRGPRDARTAQVMASLEASLGGTVVEESGRFYLQQPGIGKLEMHLVAEGLRKLGMIFRLVGSGALVDSGYLFWDEPETNLNPRTLRHAAHTVMDLAKTGVQVFLATHSLFLLRELEMLSERPQPPGEAVEVRFIGLHRSEDGVTVDAGPSVADIGDIAALDEELDQAQHYLLDVE